MPRPVEYLAPGIQFDPTLATRLARAGSFPLPQAHERSARVRSPFVGYARMLTVEGGILVQYRDLNLDLSCQIVRGLLISGLLVLGGWLIFDAFASSPGVLTTALGLLGISIWLIWNYKVPAHHSIEIRADCLIVDGRDVFYAEDIGDHWPELQAKENDSGRMVLAGICGTRFIEYTTVNRFDECDRTPEVLEADLQEAMKQLWGRRELIVPTSP